MVIWNHCARLDGCHGRAHTTSALGSRGENKQTNPFGKPLDGRTVTARDKFFAVETEGYFRSSVHHRVKDPFALGPVAEKRFGCLAVERYISLSEIMDK
jgi:hypothetical protein